MDFENADELAEFIAQLGDGSPQSNKQFFIFFSEARHRKDSRTARLHLRNTEADFYINSDGERVLGNYCGGLIDGYPGSVIEGVIVRPPNYKSYKLVGEQIAAGQTPAKGQVVSDPTGRPLGSLWKLVMEMPCRAEARHEPVQPDSRWICSPRNYTPAGHEQ